MVTRWDVVTIGNLSRNWYWGEREDAPRRKAMCTCTLVLGTGFRMVVDPSLQDAERMAEELDRRTGLHPEQIDSVFITHDHGDHHYGLRHFARARWLAAPAVAEMLNRDPGYAGRVEPSEEVLFGIVDVLPTPGHTPTHHSLRFDCEGVSVVVAGDAVMTRDFWQDGRGHFNSVDLDQAGRTIESLRRIADIVVPGHDNWFLTRRRSA